MRVLITGIGGFAGSHLAEYALNEQTEVGGTIRSGGSTNNTAQLLSSVHCLAVIERSS